MRYDIKRSIARRELIINTVNAIERAMPYNNPLIPFAFADCDERGYITAYAFNLEPNEPTVLECKDKIMTLPRKSTSEDLYNINI